MPHSWQGLATLVATVTATVCWQVDLASFFTFQMSLVAVSGPEPSKGGVFKRAGTSPPVASAIFVKDVLVVGTVAGWLKTPLLYNQTFLAGF